MRDVLQVKNLTKIFGNFVAIDNVSFYVKKGDFFSILGSSGCGKTTLLRIISGFEHPTSGEIFIRNKSMQGISADKRPVNIVFQSLALFPMMNVEKNVSFGLERLKLSKTEIGRKVNSMLERVGLKGFNRNKILELSGGQKQRVAIARSLVLEPSILLLDEPLGALDRKLREYMKIELKLLQKELKTTFIYITHDQSEALVMSDKVAVMNKGKFDQLDTPENLYNNPKTSFVASFVGENNEFKVKNYENGMIQSESGWKIFKPDLRTKPSKVFIRPQSFTLGIDKLSNNHAKLSVNIKALLFDGANTKIAVTIAGSNREVFIALPQSGQFSHLTVGDNIKVGINYDNIICF